MAKTLKSSTLTQNQKQQENLNNYEREIERKKRELVRKMKRNEERVNQIKEQNENNLILKQERSKVIISFRLFSTYLQIKQQEIENERQRLKRLEDIKKEQVTEKHHQIEGVLNENKQLNSFLEKVNTEKKRKIIKEKDEMIDKFERSFIWNK